MIGPTRGKYTSLRDFLRLAVATGCALIVLFTLCPVAISMQAEPARPNETPRCKKSTASAALSSIDSPPTVTLLSSKVKLWDTNATSLLHLYLRNSGSTALTRICISVYFADYLGKPIALNFEIRPATGNAASSTRTTTSTTLCLRTTLDPGQITTLDLIFSPNRESLPLSGTVLVGSSGLATEDAKPEATCRLDASPLTRTAVIVTTSTARVILLPILLAVIVGLVVIVPGVFLGKRLLAPMGGPQWNFTSSFAVNFTLGGSLITLVLNSVLLSDYPHYATKQMYTAFSLLFAAVVIISPPLYTFFSRPVQTSLQNGAPTIAYVGSVGLFIVAAAVSVWGVLGQMSTTALLFGEFAMRGYISRPDILILYGLLAVTGVGLVVYSWRTARFYIESHAPVAIEKGFMLQAVKQVAPMKWNVL